MIEIYGISLNDLPSVQDALSLLESAEAWRAKHPSFMENDAARASLGGLLLVQYAGLCGDLCYTESGRPYFAGQAADFNITHTKTQVFCAIDESASGSPIGLDAEDLTDARAFDPAGMAKRWFSDAERELFLQDPTLEGFLRIWTRKEAYVKRNGKGLGGIREVDTLSRQISDEVDFFAYTVDKTLVTLCTGKGRGAPDAIKMTCNKALIDQLKKTER